MFMSVLYRRSFYIISLIISNSLFAQNHEFFPVIGFDTVNYERVNIISRKSESYLYFQKSLKFYKKFLEENKNWENLDSALHYSNLSVKIENKISYYYCLRALIKNSMRQNAKTIIKDLNKAIKYDSKNWIFRFERANWYFINFQLDKALKELLIADELMPDNEEIDRHIQIFKDEIKKD